MPRLNLNESFEKLYSDSKIILESDENMIYDDIESEKVSKDIFNLKLSYPQKDTILSMYEDPEEFDNLESRYDEDWFLTNDPKYDYEFDEYYDVALIIDNRVVDVFSQEYVDKFVLSDKDVKHLVEEIGTTALYNMYLRRLQNFKDDKEQLLLDLNDIKTMAKKYLEESEYEDLVTSYESYIDRLNEDLMFDYTGDDVVTLRKLVKDEKDPIKKDYLKDTLAKAEYEIYPAVVPEKKLKEAIEDIPNELYDALEDLDYKKVTGKAGSYYIWLIDDSKENVKHILSTLRERMPKAEVKSMTDTGTKRKKIRVMINNESHINTFIEKQKMLDDAVSKVGMKVIWPLDRSDIEKLSFTDIEHLVWSFWNIEYDLKQHPIDSERIELFKDRNFANYLNKELERLGFKPIRIT